MELSDNDRYVLASVLREAALSSRVGVATSEGRTLSGFVTAVIERGTGRKMTVEEFSIDCGIENTSNKTPAFQTEFPARSPEWQFRIQAVDAVYEFGTHLIACRDATFTFRITGPLHRSDRRQGHRTVLMDQLESPLTIHSGPSVSIGMARVCDYSFESLGIELRTMVQLNTDTDFFASGMISVNGFPMRVEMGPLRRLRLIEERSHENTFSYSAGLQLRTPQTSGLSGKRLSHRVPAVGLRISLNSCLAPNFEIFMSLNDVATSGFSGKIVKPQDRHLVWSGCGVRLHGTDLRGTVIFSDDALIRVEWLLNGGEGERYWSELVSAARNPEGDLTLSNAEDLVTAFVRSGSAAPDYLKHFPLIRPNTIRGLSEESKYPEWFFKWIERDQRGKIKGHIAGYRLGDNLWCAGDLFSDPDLNQKISSEFAKGFLEQFVDFLQKKKPVPKVYGAWKVGHPFWKNTEAFLAANPDTLFADLFGTTFFPNPKSMYDMSSDGKVTEIDGVDVKEFTSITDGLRDSKTLEFARAFDFDLDRLASPRTRELFSKRGFSFIRRYLYAKIKSGEYFAIMSRFPYGVSPYNNTSIVYVLPLFGSGEGFCQNQAQELAIHCCKRGVYPHRIVLLTSQPLKNGGPLGVRTVVVQPRMWLHV